MNVIELDKNITNTRKVHQINIIKVTVSTDELLHIEKIMQVSISSITIPPRTPGISTKSLPPPWGFCILVFARGGGGDLVG